jgi:nicotinate-nucleotide adenylyltransferase
MKIAILGGSFNPVHLGHLYLAGEVLALGYDRVVLVPAFINPFKPTGPLSAGDAAAPSAEDRLEMLAAACAGDSRIAVDDCEVRREGLSYTIDTLKDVIERYQCREKPGLVMGDDLLAGFDGWKNAAEIAQIADIIVASRKNDPVQDLKAFHYPYKRLKNALMDVSSTEIRARIAQNKPWRYLVPQGVRQIIIDRGLYRQTAQKKFNNQGLSVWQPSSSDILLAETLARSMLKTSRFIHSRNVALAAVDLARRFGEGDAGLTPCRAYYAGLTHDIGKNLEPEKMLRLALKDRQEVTKDEKSKLSLLHGKAGARILKEKLGVHDREILEAVRHHTMGRPGMGNLAKIIYLADKTEAGRPGIRPEFRALERWPAGLEGLDRLFTAVLEDSVVYLRAKQVEPSDGTLRLLEAMQRVGERHGS